MPGFTVYSRRGCHLCELLIEDLLPVVGNRATVEICDIDSRPDWQQKYNTRVPVVAYRDKVVCEGRLDRHAVQRLLDSLRTRCNMKRINVSKAGILRRFVRPAGSAPAPGPLFL